MAAKGKEKPQGTGLDPCPQCGAVECGTPRIP